MVLPPASCRCCQSREGTSSTSGSAAGVASYCEAEARILGGPTADNAQRDGAGAKGDAQLSQGCTCCTGACSGGRSNREASSVHEASIFARRRRRACAPAPTASNETAPALFALATTRSIRVGSKTFTGNGHDGWLAVASSPAVVAGKQRSCDY